MEPNLTDKIVIALFASFFAISAGVLGINAWRNVGMYAEMRPAKTQAPSIETQQKKTIEQKGISVDDLKNATYHVINYDRTVTLKDGYYKEKIPGMESGIEVNIYNEDAIAFGDLNGDGKNEVALILRETAGGSGAWRDLIVMENHNGTLTQIAGVDLGDRIEVKSIAIQGKIIALDTLIHGPNDGLCCPTVHRIQKYRLVGSTLEIQSQEKYEDQKYHFEIQYPTNAEITERDNVKSFLLPFRTDHKTNLAEKYFNIEIKERAPKSCSNKSGGIIEKTENISIHGVSFLKETGSEGAAGNFYDFVNYAPKKDAFCVKITMTLHSTNSGAVTPPLPEFDRVKEFADFDKIIQTFHFTDSPDISTWKTYRNEKYGFTLNYQSDLPELRVLINDLSPITYSLVAGEPIFEIHLFDNADQFSNPLWKFDDGYDHQLTYSATGKNWIVTLANRDWNRVSGPPDESCPLEYTTSNQGVPYYRITTGYHAGDGFNAYITDKKFIAVVGGDYYESGKFYPEKITFDHPELVLKATCHIVNAGR